MMPIPPADTSRDIDRRMALAREWDELVAQVRQIEGFEDFLRPPKLEKLLPAAAEGPVVIVNISQWRCDALLVTTGGVEVKELPRLTAEGVTAQVGRYLRALRRVEEAAQAVQRAYEACRAGGGLTVAAIGAYTAAKTELQAARNDQEQMLRQVAEWLWDEITAPVLEALHFGKPAGPDGPWPRLWWCPTGPLTLLPLHAAGYHTPEGAASGDAVLDRAVSSYTPTLRALLEARGAGSPSAEGPGGPSAGGQLATSPASRMLVVALSDTPGQMPLPNVIRERDTITRLFAGRHTLLEGSAATWEAVRDMLPEHRWVHFSCHGAQNLTDPSHGGILLHDRMLTIAEISEGRYHGDFAFLSACKTATGSLALPDEAITLAAALHYTGYRHVIGTLWSVHDQAAAEVTETVYSDLISEGALDLRRAANALHQAVRRLRGDGRPLSYWTPFTHTGP
jgi:CHAT domain